MANYDIYGTKLTNPKLIIFKCSRDLMEKITIAEFNLADTKDSVSMPLTDETQPLDWNSIDSVISWLWGIIDKRFKV